MFSRKLAGKEIFPRKTQLFHTFVAKFSLYSFIFACSFLLYLRGCLYLKCGDGREEKGRNAEGVLPVPANLRRRQRVLNDL
jgi:hypothetical protein